MKPYWTDDCPPSNTNTICSAFHLLGGWSQLTCKEFCACFVVHIAWHGHLKQTQQGSHLCHVSGFPAFYRRPHLRTVPDTWQRWILTANCRGKCYWFFWGGDPLNIRTRQFRFFCPPKKRKKKLKFIHHYYFGFGKKYLFTHICLFKTFKKTIILHLFWMVFPLRNSASRAKPGRKVTIIPWDQEWLYVLVQELRAWVRPWDRGTLGCWLPNKGKSVWNKKGIRKMSGSAPAFLLIFPWSAGCTGIADGTWPWVTDVHFASQIPRAL